jgi:hypothetical protein
MNYPLFWSVHLFAAAMVMWVLLGILAYAQREFKSGLQVLMELLCIVDGIYIIYVVLRLIPYIRLG